MKRAFWKVLTMSAALVAAGSYGQALAGTSVSINIGPPAVVVAGPPEMVVIPNTMVYFAPGVEVDLLFHRDYWYTRNGDRWFRSRNYNGPWKIVGRRAVPVEIVRVPGNYRTRYARHEHVPYGQLKKHWKHRENERHVVRGSWEEHGDDHSWSKQKKGKGHDRD
ncbi:MAG: hypothetical protein FIA93_04380 [Deltaproteobacteria bacterium]|nr:hypothetical protein [Deltaproteobacteria bacterium]PWB67981.1 MAG: hypothetical protein C3F14_00710 [Deltaproteobacteria bacterium]